MKALSIPHFAEKCVIIITLFSLTTWIYPEISLASADQSGGPQPAVVFQIKDPSVLDGSQNQKSINLQQITSTDPLVVKVKQYLEDHDSPLADYAADIIQQPQWQRALGISFVESNMGKYCFDNNCSGIGVKPGYASWRKYNTKLDWFIDLNNLLETPLYKEKYTTFQKMKGVYVQPGSTSWVYGAQKVYNELMDITMQAAQERQDQLAAQLNPALALANIQNTTQIK